MALLNDKNLGKAVELNPKIGERGPFYLSIDSKINELIPLRTSYIQIPDKIKGATLSALRTFENNTENNLCDPNYQIRNNEKI